MTARYSYSTTLIDGETDAETDVAVTFSVEWGSPESGRFGPPENFDPGSPAIVEDVRLETINGEPVNRYPPEFAAALLRDVERDHENEMLGAATEDEIAAYDDAMERRWEELREERRQDPA